MENKQPKGFRKVFDNSFYKSRFQILLKTNDNIVCQRYFTIRDYDESSIYSEEFASVMFDIVNSIKKDLESKSRVFMAYTNFGEKLKLTGFVSDNDRERLREELGDTYEQTINKVLLGHKDIGVALGNGQVVSKSFMDYPTEWKSFYGDTEQPQEGEFILRFMFLVDDKPVFESAWDAGIYPKFVRCGIDLSNNIAQRVGNDPSKMSFGDALVWKMQLGKINLIADSIKSICSVCANPERAYNYKRELDGYVDADGNPYTYYSNLENSIRYWKKYHQQRTREYFGYTRPANGKREQRR